MTPQSFLNTNLNGKTALVCGASAGIGEASSRILASLGAKIIGIARTESNLKKVIEALPGTGHSYLALDLTDHKLVGEKVSEALVKAGGAIEILINNSAGPKGGPLLEATFEEFTNTFSQQLLASHLLSQLLIPGMKQRGYGRVINVISTSVRAPIMNLGVSNTIRGAVASWAKTLSLEVAAHGITVNSVLPGYTKTARLEGLLKAGAQKSGRTEQAIADEWKNAVPARRFAEPEELGSVIAFLASPAAAYINGVSLPVDGGRTPSI
jgi:3-oxoacyl-[acyl-carrier protein] reductase